MRRLYAFTLVLCLAGGALCARERTDTLRISDLFTTHIIFNTDLIYADLSNSQVVAAKILDQSKNMMALKARAPFYAPLSVSALESNGTMHTYIVTYDPEPGTLVYDMRAHHENASPRGKKANKGGAGLYRKGDAPLLQDVVTGPQRLWHIATRSYDIEIVCTNILSYSDITYIVFSVDNRSGVSYECPDAAFVVESRKRSRRGVVYDKSLFPKSRSGTASCAPGTTTRIGYSLDKVSLSKEQVLRVYFYELGGQRELVLTIGAKDINHAKSAL
jgi:hypothetical protein